MTTADTNTTAALAEPGAHVAPAKAPSKKLATVKKGAPRAKKTSKAAAPAKKAKAGKKAAAKSEPEGPCPARRK